MNRPSTTAATLIYMTLIGLAVALMCWLAAALGEVSDAMLMAPAAAPVSVVAA